MHLLPHTSHQLLTQQSAKELKEKKKDTCSDKSVHFSISFHSFFCPPFNSVPEPRIQDPAALYHVIPANLQPEQSKLTAYILHYLQIITRFVSLSLLSFSNLHCSHISFYFSSPFLPQLFYSSSELVVNTCECLQIICLNRHSLIIKTHSLHTNTPTSVWVPPLLPAPNPYPFNRHDVI